MIHGCLGFAISRIFPDGSEPEKPLAAWVPFKEQSNKDWDPQDTTI